MAQIPPMVEWRYASTGCGELYALIGGMMLMPELSVDNVDMTHKV